MNHVIDYLGRRWSPEFNCWDFVLEFYHKELGVILEPHHVMVASAVRQAHEAFRTEAVRSEWSLEENPVLGDVAVFRRRSLSYHVGVMLDRTTVLHLPENSPSCAIPIRRLLTQFDAVQFYRHSNIKKPCHGSLS